MKKMVKVGQIYEYDTSDAVDMLTKESINQHKENTLIKEVSKDRVITFNLNDQTECKFKKDVFEKMLKLGWFKLTNQVG